MSFWLELVATGLITGGIYAVVAIGLNLQYGLMRIMNIAHGEFLMLGAYFTWLAAHGAQGQPARLPAGRGPGALPARPRSSTGSCFRPDRAHRAERRRDRSAQPARRASASCSWCRTWRYLAWGADLRGYSFLDEPVEIGGARFTANRLVVFGFAVVASLALIAVLRFTLVGKAVRAMMQSPTGAQLVGIDTAVLHPVVFGVGLALAGVAGALLSMVYEISPAMGEPYTVTALIVIMLGGLGSTLGALVGRILLGVVEAFGMHFTSPSLKMLLSYGVFIAVLLARPKGLFAR